MGGPRQPLGARRALGPWPRQRRRRMRVLRRLPWPRVRGAGGARLSKTRTCAKPPRHDAAVVTCHLVVARRVVYLRYFVAANLLQICSTMVDIWIFYGIDLLRHTRSNP